MIKAKMRRVLIMAIEIHLAVLTLTAETPKTPMQ
jgi:hypothetical protein